MKDLIGIFDSGAGGLTVLRAMERVMPEKSYLYFGDTARVPYGPRTPKEVEDFVLEIGDFLVSAGCELILIACNTATAAGLAALRAASPVPVYGMIEAAAAAARDLARSGANPWPVGLAATEGTVKSGAYDRAMTVLAQALERESGGTMPRAPGFGRLISKGCPRFVSLVEKGVTKGPDAAKVIDEDLRELKAAGIGSLILGCTHFPFLAEEIHRYLGQDIALIDPAEKLAELVKEEAALRGRADLDSDTEGQPAAGMGRRLFYCSGYPGAFQKIGGLLLGRPLDEVRRKTF